MNDISFPTTLISDVKALSEATRQRVAGLVNAELTQRSWQVGTLLNAELHQRGGSAYSRQTVRELARQLEAEYGRSYAEKSPRCMRQFADILADLAPVATLWRQGSWSC